MIGHDPVHRRLAMNAATGFGRRSERSHLQQPRPRSLSAQPGSFQAGRRLHCAGVKGQQQPVFPALAEGIENF
jgi:hypothetical protein